MKVLLVNGSPHESGCTDAALSFVSSALREEGIETEKFWVGTGAISGCIACHACRKTGVCVRSERVQTVVELADKADGFVFGSPVHYAAISGHMKSFMDRLFFSEFQGNRNAAFRLKPVAGVTVARRCGSATAFSQLNKYFTIQEMFIVSSRYWNDVFALTADEIPEDKEGLCNMRVIGRNMAYFLRCREAAEKAGVPLPKVEEPVFTNFTR